MYLFSHSNGNVNEYEVHGYNSRCLSSSKVLPRSVERARSVRTSLDPFSDFHVMMEFFSIIGKILQGSKEFV